MISLLTALVLMVAVGTVIQKADSVPDIFSPGASSDVNALRLVDDQAIVRANTLSRLDVLANDTGVGPEQSAGLAVLRAPGCGQVFVQSGSLQYLPGVNCLGERRLVYTVPDVSPDGAATVFLRVIGAEEVEPAPVVAAVAQEDAEKTPVDKTPEDKTAEDKTAEDKTAEDVAPVRPTPAPVQANAGEGGAIRAAQTPAAQLAPVTEETSVAQLADSARAARPTAAAGLEKTAETSDAGAMLARAGGGQDTERVSAGGEDRQPELAEGAATAIQRDPVALPRAPDDLAAPRVDAAAEDEIELAALDAPGRPVEDLMRPAPLSADPVGAAGGGSGVLIALLERREPPTAALPMPRGPRAEPAIPAKPAVLAANSPDTPVAAAFREGAMAGQGTPPGSALNALPVDRDQPPPARLRPEPAAPQEPEEGRGLLARLFPRQTDPVPISATQPAPVPQSQPEPQPRIAALPPSDAPCVAPPSTAIDVKRAARTVLHVLAPCHAGTVAELRYSGISFAVPLDAEGRGEILTLGFEANAPALLTFLDGTEIDFDLPFRSIQRVQRVALVWDQPVSLELNALEFGAEVRSAGHVDPENRRDFSEVRRSGGGFLNSFRSTAGIGQNAEVYTFWNRTGSSGGIVRLLIDFASRNRDRLEGTCGAGPLASPQYLVLRSDGGQMARPILRRLAAMGCSEIDRGSGDNRLISGGIDDLIVR